MESKFEVIGGEHVLKRVDGDGSTEMILRRVNDTQIQVIISSADMYDNLIGFEFVLTDISDIKNVINNI